jgi:hypothetical protein
MVDVIDFILIGIAGALSTLVMIEVFRWGYEKEKRGERYGKKK